MGRRSTRPLGPDARPSSGANEVVGRATALGVPPAPVPAGPVVAAAPVEAYVGTIIADRYRILRKLGEGGMGVVYPLAEHIIIEKRVALKILSEDFARKADLVQRFMQEAKAASRIGHENIVDITDFGETPSGSVFIAMEFLDGKDLANHIRDEGIVDFDAHAPRHHPGSAARSAPLHAKGIIHRDLKPENLFLIEQEGRADFVKIARLRLIAKMNSLDSDGGSAPRRAPA